MLSSVTLIVTSKQKALAKEVHRGPHSIIEDESNTIRSYLANGLTTDKYQLGKFNFSKSLQLILSVDKQIYSVGENINFLLTFKNVSMERIHIFEPEYYYAELLRIIDEKNNTMRWKRKVFYDLMWSKDDFKLIEPKSNHKWVITGMIALCNGKLLINFGDSVIFLKKAGKYEVSVEYEGWDGLTTDKIGKTISVSEALSLKNVFIGSLISNTIGFEIML